MPPCRYRNTDTEITLVITHESRVQIIEERPITGGEEAEYGPITGGEEAEDWPIKGGDEAEEGRRQRSGRSQAEKR